MLVQKHCVAFAAAVGSHRWSPFLLSLIALAAIADPAQGQVDWINWTNSNCWYDEGTNWSGGSAPGSTDTAQFNLSNTYEVWWNASTPIDTPDVGFLHVLDGDVTFLNTETTTQWELTINGSSSLTDLWVDGATTSLTIDGIHLHSLGGARLSTGATLMVDDSASVGSILTIDNNFQVDSTLHVEARGVVSNDWGYIGYESGSTGEATVTGADSQWNNSGQLLVGYDGNGTLYVEAGGEVSSARGYIGVASVSTSEATVTGAGSQWNNSDRLHVGDAGNGTLNVLDGGVVSNTEGAIGYWSGSTGVATVTGTGSQWTSTGNLSLGRSADSGVGSLTISNNGTVFVGDAAGSGTGGWLIVSDADSGGSAGGHLYVYNGSTLTHSGSAMVGQDSGEYGWVTVDGAGSEWNNSSTLTVGDYGNGTLNVLDGGVVSNTGGYIGDQSGSTSEVTVTGTSSQWNNSGNVSVGYFGNGTLNVEAGGVVSNDWGYIGHQSGSTGMATVTGTDSQWNNSGQLLVGYDGNGTLHVEAGGEVSSASGYIGVDSVSTSEATVTGTDSQWNNSGQLLVGYFGNGTLNVEAGGVVSNYAGAIGYWSGSTGVATVTGADSQWNNSGNLLVGFEGNGTLNVEDGGVVSNAAGFIGHESASTGEVTVTGADSWWKNSGDLLVGGYGTGTLNVLAGGVVSNTEGAIGYWSGSTGVATVTGTGSQWTSTGNLSLGRSADSGVGSLTISNNGTVFVGDAADSGTGGWLIVSDADSGGSAGGHLYVYNGSTLTHSGSAMVGEDSGEYGWVTVDGTDSQWNNSGDLLVGGLGNGTLHVEAGGVVSNTEGAIGVLSGSTSEVTVTGTRSQWNNSSNLWVGGLGNGTLNVEAEGVVSNDWGYIGYASGSTGEVTVTGTDSQWNNSGQLLVGYDGNGTLYVEAGGEVSSARGYIGVDSVSTSEATVTGTDSQWNNSDRLHVGDFGTGTLNVLAGGVVSNTEGAIGYWSGSTGVATVTGADSQWNNSGDLWVGEYGNGTLNVEAGGVVSNDWGYIGYVSGSTGEVTVTGADSQWNNSGTLFVGYAGNGTLNVQNNGLVQVDATLYLRSKGTINLDGGSIAAAAFDNTDGGTFNFIAGMLTINSGITIGNDPDGVFPDSFSVNPERGIATAATTTISAFRSLTLNGGSLTTNSLVVDGFFNFDHGILELTGGAITGLESLSVPTGGEFRATGTHALPITGAAGSMITATGNLVLGDSNDTSGFYSNGIVNVDDNMLTLNDLNDVAFDSGSSVGLGSAGTGILNASNGLTLDFGGNIAGYGTIDTPNDPTKPLINNGHITGNSLAEPITLPGYVKGVGTCDNCNITGTDAPGFSTAAVNRGSVSYNGTLEIEIGGTSPGSGYDQLNHILGAGIADLGGTLDIALINGFTPTAGDTFGIITALNLLDEFDTVNLSTLPGELLWFVNYGTTSVELVSTFGADFDEDGDVDGDDFLSWQTGFGTNAGATHANGDADSDGDVDGDDFLTWQAQFGSVAGSAATAVPEPTSVLLMLGVVVVGMCARRCRVR